MLAHPKAGHNGPTGVPVVKRVAKTRQECVGENAWVVSMLKQSVRVFLLNIKHVRSPRVHNGSNGVNGTLALFHVAMEHVGGNENVRDLETTNVSGHLRKQKSVHPDHAVDAGTTGQNGVIVQSHVELVSRQDQEIVKVVKWEEEIVSVLQERKSEYGIFEIEF